MELASRLTAAVGGELSTQNWKKAFISILLIADFSFACKFLVFIPFGNVFRN
jgi:hypothetical protein